MYSNQKLYSKKDIKKLNKITKEIKNENN